MVGQYLMAGSRDGFEHGRGDVEGDGRAGYVRGVLGPGNAGASRRRLGSTSRGDLDDGLDGVSPGDRLGSRADRGDLLFD
jgi:hypothetical protein